MGVRYIVGHRSNPRRYTLARLKAEGDLHPAEVRAIKKLKCNKTKKLPGLQVTKVCTRKRGTR